ncbi:MAG TPA: class I SAM-dependent methyltransferase [Amycolatopsis sp.]|nr:class I SAM-dependent methyltransferase [Amycolatopsis sp.]
MLRQVLYRYPDTGDRVTGGFIRRHEPFPGYWAESEARALEKLGAELAAILPPREKVRALDAGCGEGRLLGWLSRFAATITAVDPDPGRLANAREARIPDTDLSFAVAPVTEIQDGPFDLVLCSHVVQHIPTGELVPTLRRLHEVAAPDAVLALTYSRAPVGQGGFFVETLEDNGFRARPVGRAEFDHELDAGPAGSLPVRLLDPAELSAEAARAGWRTAWEWTYHVLDDLGAEAVADRDEYVNASPELRRDLGRDQVALLRREDR